MVDTREAMKLLDVSEATLYRLVDRGQLTPANLNPALKRPKRFLFRRADVLALLQKGGE